MTKATKEIGDKILRFLNPVHEAKKASAIIQEKINYLSNRRECKGEEESGEGIRKKVREEIEGLGRLCEKQLKRLIDREFERKAIIEDKCKSFTVMVSLVGVISSLMLGMGRVHFTLAVLLVMAFIYVTIGFFALLTVLFNENIVYEVPDDRQDDLNELQIACLANRYKNMIRTNYLSAFYSSIKRFFVLLMIFFVVYYAFYYSQSRTN